MMRAVDAFSKYCFTYELFQEILTYPFQLSMILLIMWSCANHLEQKLGFKNVSQLFHFKYRPSGMACLEKWLPDRNGFQTRDDRSHRDTGLVSFEHGTNSVVYVSICDSEPSWNGACSWKILGTIEVTCGKIIVDVWFVWAGCLHFRSAPFRWPYHTNKA